MSAMNISEEKIKEAWNKANKVSNVNPDSYRKDRFGAWMRRCRFEEKEFPLSFGWTIISVQQAEGTSEDIPLQWQNAEFSSLSKSNQRVTAEGFYNKYFTIK
jgi:hypothetical protein